MPDQLLGAFLCRLHSRLLLRLRFGDRHRSSASLRRRNLLGVRPGELSHPSLGELRLLRTQQSEEGFLRPDLLRPPPLLAHQGPRLLEHEGERAEVEQHVLRADRLETSQASDHVRHRLLRRRIEKRGAEPNLAQMRRASRAQIPHESRRRGRRLERYRVAVDRRAE